MPQNLFGRGDLPAAQTTVDPEVQRILDALLTRSQPQPAPDLPSLDRQRNPNRFKDILGAIGDQFNDGQLKRDRRYQAAVEAQQLQQGRQRIGLAERDMQSREQKDAFDAKAIGQTDADRAAFDLNGLKAMTPDMQRAIGGMRAGVSTSPLKPEQYATAGEQEQNAQTNLRRMVETDTATKGPQSPDVLGRLAEINAQGKASERVAGVRAQYGSTQFDPADVERAANAVVNGQLSPAQAAQAFGGMGGNASQFKREMNLRVLAMKPDFNFQESEANYRFGAAPATQGTVRYIDNIRNTIPSMQRLVDKMQLGNVRLVNRASLEASKQFGEGEVAAYELMQTLLSDELAKILQGGGTGSQTSDAKIQQALHLMAQDMSPDQWKAVLGTADEMLSIRADALKRGTFMDKGGAGQAPAAPGGPTIGERRTINGQLAEWDGKGWKAVK